MYFQGFKKQLDHQTASPQLVHIECSFITTTTITSIGFLFSLCEGDSFVSSKKSMKFEYTQRDVILYALGSE